MYLNPKTLSNQGHWVSGLIELTSEQEEIYLQHNGFVLVTEDEEFEKGYSITPNTKNEKLGRSQLKYEQTTI